MDLKPIAESDRYSRVSGDSSVNKAYTTQNPSPAKVMKEFGTQMSFRSPKDQNNKTEMNIGDNK